jgi:tetratricopeptide (TPR) repeat protein
VAALAPEETRVEGRLIALVRKDLVRPEPTVVAEDEAFRFRHLLIRDTAYEALPKAVRAELHERFAAWLRAHATAIVELDELIAYHLEQAYRYRLDLGPLDDAAHALAARAGEHLLVSAERARTRGESDAAIALLSRAVELLPAAAAAHREAQVELAVVVAETGDFAGASALLREADAAARAAGDRRVLARSTLARVETDMQSDVSATLRAGLEASERALAELELAGDDEGVVWALRVVGNLKAWLGTSAEAEQLWARALKRAETTSPRLANELREWMAWALWWGPTPVDDAIRLCDELARQASSPRLEATILLIRGFLKAAGGSVQEGRDETAAGRALFHELGARLWWAGTSMVAADIELRAGAPERAYELLTEGQTVLAESAEAGYVATVVGLRAQAAFELGRDDEALALADETQRIAAVDDLEPRARARLVRARVLARLGKLAEAEALIREAAEIVDPTDYMGLHLDLAVARADVARDAGRLEDQRVALEHAVDAAEAKGFSLAGEQVRRRLAKL